MANKFLDADGVKIFWDKINRTFLSQDDADNNFLGKTENAVSATTSSVCTGNAASASKLQIAKTFAITDGVNTSATSNFDGSQNISIALPKKIQAEIDGNSKTATTLDTARKILTDLETNSAGNFDGSTDIKIGVTGILPTSSGGTGKNNLDDVTVGKAKKATTLETARKIQADLSSTNAANFNGSADIELGVKGILEVANGGTGNSVGNANSATKLLNPRSITIQDFLAVNSGRPANFDGSQNISIRLPETIQATLTGNAETSTRAERDFLGNTITETYAPLDSPELKGTPQAPTANPNDDSQQLATTAFVAEAIRRLVGAAPQTLDTLVELAVAINKDANFATTIAEKISQKQDKSDALTSISNLLTGSDKMIFTKSANVYETTPLTAFARSLLDDANALLARNTLDALGKTENAVSATTAKECSGNSATASKLETARKFSVQDFYSANFGEDLNFDGSENVALKLPKTIQAEIIGNSATASKLQSAKTFSITDGENSGATSNFDGSENVAIALPKKFKADLIGNSSTATKLEHAKSFSVTDGENSGATSNFDGSENISLYLPKKFKADLIGNSSTASKLENAKTFSITDGENTGELSTFDGSENVSLYLPTKIKAELDGKFSTPRTLQTNLENNSAASFDGSQNISLGVTGILTTENGGTGKNNLAEVTVGAATTADKDSLGNIISETYLPKFDKVFVTIPTSDWQITSDHDNFNYCYTLEIPDIAAGDFLNLILSPDSHGAAVNCGLCPTIEISNGFISIFAKEIPANEIVAEYFSLKGASTKNLSYGAINNSTSQRVIIYSTPEQDGTLYYSGGVLRPIWKNYDPSKLLISGETSGIDAKSYAVTFTPIGNCTWSDDTRTPRRQIWKISKAIIQVPAQNGELFYNGDLQSPTLLNFDSNKMILSGDFENKIDAGTYTAYATPTENFTFEDSSGAKPFSWQILKLPLDKPTATNTDKIFNGVSQAPTFSDFNSAYIVQTGVDSATNAGDYSATYELRDKSNTQWNDGSQDAVSLFWKIDKAELEFSLDKISLNLENAQISDVISINRAGDGFISATVEDSNVATVEVVDTQITITALTSGNTKIFIDIAEGTNYLSGTSEVDVQTFVIKPLNQCSPAEILDAVKSEKAIHAWNVGDKTSPISLNGVIGAALTLNNFEVCARILGFNHNATLETDGNSSVHFALDITADGFNIAFCDSNFDSASASGVDYFQHNTKFGSNSGGWAESNIRTNILPAIFNALPDEWKNIISPCTKYTANGDNVSATNDNLFLLSEFEVFGRLDYALDAEQNFQAQYDFFRFGNDKIHFRHDDLSAAAFWWLRTPQFSNDTSFCRVDTAGVETSYNALYSLGIVPCFVVR